MNRAPLPGSSRRRQPAARGGTSVLPPDPSMRSLRAESRRGEVRFFLQRVAGGLYVEREDIPRRGLRTLQSLHFDGSDPFRRWCEGDPIRFEYPLLHVNLKREGDELWRLDAGDGIA